MVSGLTTLTCDRLTAREWFKMRELLNGVIGTGVGLIIFFLLLPVSHPLIAVLISGAIGYGICFLLLDKRAIYINCQHCGKIIETNTPWICGSKGCRNENVDDFPLIYRCEHCGYYPKAYVCHHTGCSKPIYLSKDEQGSGFARCANAPPPEKPKPVKDPHEAEVAKEKNEIEIIRLKVDKAKLSVELKDQ